MNEMERSNDHHSRRDFLRMGTASALAAGAGLWPTPRTALTSGRPLAGRRAADVDVLIFDSTPAAIIAAIAVARAGYRPLIVTEDRHVGGMQTSGLGNTNAGRRETVGGMAREFYDRVDRYYVNRYGPDSAQVAHYRRAWQFESHVAEQVYLDWLRESGVEVWTDEWIESVEKDGARIRAARLRSGRVVHARRFIDASYEGDLLKLAGCTYHLGRESSRTYGESLAGVRFPSRELGKGDRKVQSFDFRICLTDVPGNQVAFRESAGYDPANYDYERLIIRARPITRIAHTDLISFNQLPNRKTDSRTVKLYGGAWDFPEASPSERLRIVERHREHAEGFIWFILTHQSVPTELRDELARWGYAADEFVDNGNWPHHIYVREARRLVGDYVMTQADVSTERFKSDAVALGSFYLDVHPVEILKGTLEQWEDDDAAPPAAHRSGIVPNPQPPIYTMVPEGRLGNQRVRPYEIPYRVLLPKRAEADNLLVPICSSSSHVAFSTLRMEPVYQMLGHASGLAAAISLEQDVPVQTVSAGRLREQLIEQGQVVDARSFTEVWP